MQPRLWYIRGLPLFSSEGDLAERLRTIGRMERWGHRATVPLHNDPREVRVVLDGRLELADGAYDSVTQLTPGDLFGELGDAEPNYQLQAYGDLLLASLPRADFETETASALGTMSATVGVVRRRQLEVPVSALLYTSPQRRVGNVLLHLVESIGDVSGDEGELDFMPRTRSLSRLCGLADPTVSDIVDGFKRDQIVEVGRTKLVVPSIERMRQLAIG